MITIPLLIFAFLVGGFLKSLQGGMIGRILPAVQGDVIPRLVYAVPTGLLVGLLVGSWWAALAGPGLIYLGCLIRQGWTFGHPLAAMYLGIVRGGIVGLGVADFVNDLWVLPVLLLAGASAGLAEWLGYRCPSPLPKWRLPYSGEMAEFFNGGLFWVILILAGVVDGVL